MKLVSFDDDGARLGALIGDEYVLDLPRYWATSTKASTKPPSDALSLLEQGAAGLAVARDLIAEVEAHVGTEGFASTFPVRTTGGLRWEAPLCPRHVYAIGLNYRSHAEEQGAKIPASPVVFTKATSSVIGHLAPITLPPESEAVDYEAELAVIIGKRCANARVDEAMDYVAGYTCLNDVTARDLQRRDRQWFRSKSYPTFCPLGRDLVTVDSAPPLEQITVSSTVNGETRQCAPITDLIFGVPELIAFISSFTVLEVGDVIATGTPGGVGFVLDPPTFLQEHDRVTVTASGITTLDNQVAARIPR